MPRLPFAPPVLVPPEDPAYLETQIITCIGNKRALLPFIGQGRRGSGNGAAAHVGFLLGHRHCRVPMPGCC
jgi:hypothetical protein